MFRIAICFCVGFSLVAPDLSSQEHGFFSGARLVPNLNTAADEIALRLTQDGLEAVFKSSASGDDDIWITRRETLDDDFGPPEPLPASVNSSAHENDPGFSADGLELYFGSWRTGPGSSGGVDLWLATRANRSEPFEQASPLTEINTPYIDIGSAISTDGRSLIFQSDRPGTLGASDLWVASRTGRGEPFGSVQNLGPKINNSLHDFAPSLSFDGSTLLFARSDFANIPVDIFIATRASGTLTFSTAVPMRAPVNSADWDSGNALSADWPRTGAKIYFGSYRAGGPGQADIWEATWAVVIDGIQCSTSDCRGAQLQWSNPNGLEYDAVAVRRGTRKIADLDAAAMDFTDEAAEAGTHVYTVIATYNGATYFQRCTVEIACLEPRFLRGDANASGAADMADAVYTLSWLFTGGPAPGCLAAANANGDAAADISDATYLLGFLFLGSQAPVAPFPRCGEGELDADRELGCVASQPNCP